MIALCSDMRSGYNLEFLRHNLLQTNGYNPPPMSRGIVWLLAFSTGCVVANIYYVQPLLAEIARNFGLSVAQIGAVAMLGQIGTGLGMLFFVPLGDKFERRSLISGMLVLEAVALAFAATAHTIS